MAVGFGLFRLFKGDVAANLEHTIGHLHLDPDNQLVSTRYYLGLWPACRKLRLIEAGTFFYATLHTMEGIGLLWANAGEPS